MSEAKAVRPAHPFVARESPVRHVPGRTLLTWALAFGISGRMLRLAARRGDLLAQMVVDPALRGDPFPAYDEVRRRGPLVTGRLVSGTATHAVANQVLRSSAFGVGGGHGELPQRVRRLLVAVEDPGALGPLDPPSMLATDPPDHTRYRKLVSRVFTPRAVAGLEPQVERVADDLLDRLAVHADRDVDLVEAYAAQLPVAMIAAILGIPAEMHQRLLTLGDSAALLLDPGLTWQQYRDANRATRELYTWFDEHLEYLRRNPGDNLLSQLVQLDGPDQLTDLELRATGLLVLAAGFETTVNLISNAVAQFAEHPDQLALLRERPELWPNATEEVLRYDSPVQVTLRQAYEDSDIDGVSVSAGRSVLVMIGGANRDPDVFADPHRFAVDRDNAGDHLAFSSGIHYCLGASLARMEATIALRRLYERFPGTEVAGQPLRRPNRVLRGYQRLPVRLEP